MDDRFCRRAQSYPSYVPGFTWRRAGSLADQPGFVSAWSSIATAGTRYGTTLDHHRQIRFVNSIRPRPAGKTAVTCFLADLTISPYWIDLRRDIPTTIRSRKAAGGRAVIDVLERRLPGIRNRIDTTDIATPAASFRSSQLERQHGGLDHDVLAAVFEPMPRHSLASAFFHGRQWVRSLAAACRRG